MQCVHFMQYKEDVYIFLKKVLVVHVAWVSWVVARVVLCSY